jgi:O-methyltransferase involved in polyketide biosynthesis
VVILWAGFDCRAYRIAGIERTRVFEVDHPDTSAEKRRRLRQVFPSVPAHVQFVATDFDHRQLEELMANAGYDPARRTFFSWEGVTNYLTASAIDVTFRWVATAARGSQVAFTYVHRRVLDDPQAFAGTGRLFRTLRRTRESWTFGLDPAEVPGYLAVRGLDLLEDPGAVDYRARYLRGRGREMRGYEFYRIALARIQSPGTEPDSIVPRHPLFCVCVRAQCNPYGAGPDRDSRRSCARDVLRGTSGDPGEWRKIAHRPGVWGGCEPPRKPANEAETSRL